ncbi:MAG: ribosome maturation factor RimP, partial [Lachnospiraceae bacterium]|nr:ribosome maturation factor RimP [Lachnospiraceae bacterium]
EYVKEGDEYFLNVYIDKDGGVNINDCENVSRLLSDALDKDDPNPDAYTLIVSSPGLGRALTKDRHLQQSIGQDVELHLYKPHSVSGEKDILGELLAFDQDEIVLAAEPPVPAKGKGKAKGGKKGSAKKSAKKAAEEEASGQNAQEMTEETEQPVVITDETVLAQQKHAEETNRIRLTVSRKEIASIRLAFDF